MKTKRPSTPKYNVPAVEKALDILEALAVTATPQSLADLARTLNRTSSELFRMLTVLERRAYVLRDPQSDGYSLSLRLYELAHTHSPVDQLLRAASQPMRALADSVRESCHLSVMHRDQLLVLMQMESPEKLRLSIEVGARFEPLHATSGRLLLAMLPEEERETLLEANAAFERLSRKEQERIRVELSSIHESGYAIASSETRAGMKDIAVAIGNHAIGVTAALTIPCLLGGRDERDLHRLRLALQRCAAQITAALGLTAPGQASPRN